MEKYSLEQFRKAVVLGDFFKVRKIMDKSKFHKKLGKTAGMSLLYDSVARGNINITMLLAGHLECGVKKNLQRKLIAAVVSGDLGLAKSMLAKGASLQEPEWKSTSLYSYIFQSKVSKEMLRLLVINGLDQTLLIQFREIHLNNFVKKILKLTTDERFVLTEDLNEIKKSPIVQQHFDKCLSELQKLANSKFYESYFLITMY